MYTGRIPCLVTDALKTKANETWRLIDRDEGGYLTFSVPLTNSPNGTNITGWGTSTQLERVCHDALQPGVSNAAFDTFMQSRSAELGRPVPNNPGQFRAQFSIGAEGQDFDAFIQSHGYYRLPEVMGAQSEPKK